MRGRRRRLYPLPALLPFAGLVYVLLMRPGFEKEVRLAFVLILAGLLVYVVRARTRRVAVRGEPRRAYGH